MARNLLYRYCERRRRAGARVEALGRGVRAAVAGAGQQHSVGAEVDHRLGGVREERNFAGDREIRRALPAEWSRSTNHDMGRACEFVRPPRDAPEMAYLHARREKLGGYLPARRAVADSIATPDAAAFAKFALEANGKEMSTTVAFVRMVGALLRDAAIGKRIVPIIADEARTFGMADLFRQIGIYSPIGQLYEPRGPAFSSTSPIQLPWRRSGARVGR